MEYHSRIDKNEIRSHRIHVIFHLRLNRNLCYAWNVDCYVINTFKNTRIETTLYVISFPRQIAISAVQHCSTCVQFSLIILGLYTEKQCAKRTRLDNLLNSA